MARYNLRNPAVKRLMKEAEELSYPSEEYHAQPLEDNLFEWHFTLRGPPNSDYEGGIYHGRITLPPDYPMKPPSIILLTPNGRFETNKKICLSISGHHPETWQPSWSIRTALLAIIGFMPTHGNGAVGSLDYTPEERQALALKSQNWMCSECGYIRNVFDRKDSTDVDESDEFQDFKNSSSSGCDVTNSLSNTSEDPNLSSEAETDDATNLDSIYIYKTYGDIPNNRVPVEHGCIERRNVATRHEDLKLSEKEDNLNTSNSVERERKPISEYCSLLLIYVIIFIFLALLLRRGLNM